MRTRAFVNGFLGLLLILAAGAVRADPIPVWWAPSLAPAGVEALEAAFEEPFLNGPMKLQGPQGAEIQAAACEDVADALDRRFTPVKATAKSAALRCAALGKVLLAAEAESSTFRLAPGTRRAGPLVPGGTPRGFTIESVAVLPAYLAPRKGCGFGLLALRASDRFWSLARFAHVYGAGEKDDGRAAEAVNSKAPRALSASLGPDGSLHFKQNGDEVVLALLGLGDFDGDGAEDALIRKSTADGDGSLHMVSQFRPGAVMRLRDLSDRYADLIVNCPDLVLEFAAASELEDTQ